MYDLQSTLVRRRAFLYVEILRQHQRGWLQAHREQSFLHSGIQYPSANCYCQDAVKAGQRS